MQKKLFLVLFGMIALISLPIAQTFGQDGPVRALNCHPDHEINWSSPNWHPEVGDIIVVVNGVPVSNEDEFRKEVRNSPDTIFLGVIDHCTNQFYILKAQLWPSYSQIRLGIYVKNSQNQKGVVVTDCMPNSPGTHCQYLKSIFTQEKK